MMRTCIRLLLAAGAAAVLLWAQSVAVSDKPVPVKGQDQQSKLIKKVNPKYPPEAKAAGIQGVVKLEVVINKDGTVKDIKTLRGPKELVPPAVEAVKQWQWEPTTVNGKAVEVITEIDINYTLGESKKAKK